MKQNCFFPPTWSAYWLRLFPWWVSLFDDSCDSYVGWFGLFFWLIFIVSFVSKWDIRLDYNYFSDIKNFIKIVYVQTYVRLLWKSFYFLKGYEEVCLNRSNVTFVFWCICCWLASILQACFMVHSSLHSSQGSSYQRQWLLDTCNSSCSQLLPSSIARGRNGFFMSLSFIFC